MPGVIGALTDWDPFSILTKGTLLRRDLPLLPRPRSGKVSAGVSIAFWTRRCAQRGVGHAEPAGGWTWCGRSPTRGCGAGC